MPLSIPEGVSEHLVKELERIQLQLVILKENQKILTNYLRKEPQNAILRQKLTWVEEYIVQFDNEQKPTLTAIRAEVKALKEAEQAKEVREQEAPKEAEVKQEEPEIKQEPPPEEPAAASEELPAVAEDDSAAPTPIKEEETPEVSSEEDSKAALSSSDAVAVVAVPTVRKQAMQDRMAAVRGAKKTGKKCGRPPKVKKKGLVAAAAATDERTPSPEQEGEDDDSMEYIKIAERELAREGVKGHVDETEKFTADLFPYFEAAHDPIVFPIEKENMELQNNKEEMKLNYFRHLDLYITSDTTKIEEVAKVDRKRKFDYRNMTLIPEFTEKKQRFSYNWMSNDHVLNNFSPPRTRGGRSNKNPLTNITELEATLRAKRRLGGLSAPASATATATPSGETSRATTPDNSAAVTANNSPKELSPSSASDVKEEPEEVVVSPAAESSSAEPAEVIRMEVTENAPVDVEAMDVVVESEPEAPKEQPSPNPEAEVTPTSAPAAPPAPLTPTPVRESKRSLVRDRQRAKLLKHKPAKEEELATLVKRSEELRVQIEGNGLTVATRKERSKKTGLSKERDGLEEKIKQLKGDLAKCDGI